MRGKDGRKWAIKGSKQGLFIPRGLDNRKVMFICEGPTDTAAMLDLGFNAVGRPSCMGATDLICELVAGHGAVAIMADRDGPGMDGAERLAHSLRSIVGRVFVMSPPEGYKDVRAWYCGGELRKEDALEYIKAESCRHGNARSQATT
jgi:DNA primase